LQNTFRIPFGDMKRAEQWKSAIGLLNIEPGKNHFVCQHHFLNSDFNQEGVDVNVKKLKINTVPSLLLPVRY